VKLVQQKLPTFGNCYMSCQSAPEEWCFVPKSAPEKCGVLLKSAHEKCKIKAWKGLFFQNWSSGRILPQESRLS
ncbi:MAG: hypothetical protein II611_06725, partial [Treponema sp.]|nr:hypothetical protein [Treponema sp.]